MPDVMCRMRLHRWRWQGFPGWSYAECAQCRRTSGGFSWWQWRVRCAPKGDHWRDHA